MKKEEEKKIGDWDSVDIKAGYKIFQEDPLVNKYIQTKKENGIYSWKIFDRMSVLKKVRSDIDGIIPELLKS